MPTRFLLLSLAVLALLALARRRPRRPTTCPGEVIVQLRRRHQRATPRRALEDGTGTATERGAARAAPISSRSRTATRCARRSPSCGATRTWPTRCRTTRARRGVHARTTPASRRQWNLFGSFGHRHARGVGARRASAARPVGAARSWRCSTAAWPTRAAGASGARPTCAARPSSAATTSSDATATPTTPTATAPTWRARSPSPRTTAWRTAGIAYGAKIMPLRVLDDAGSGDSARHRPRDPLRRPPRADVINMSLEFDPREVRAARSPTILSAIRYAHRARRGGGGGGRQPGRPRGGLPARAPSRDRRGRHHDQRLPGRLLELRRGPRPRRRPAAAWTRANADSAWDIAALPPGRSGRLDLPADLHARSVRRFGLPGGYEGTSMASPHVAAIAALVIATKRLGAEPDAARGRGAPRGHRARPRPPGPTALRRRAASTRRRAALPAVHALTRARSSG